MTLLYYVAAIIFGIGAIPPGEDRYPCLIIGALWTIAAIVSEIRDTLNERK